MTVYATAVSQGKTIYARYQLVLVRPRAYQILYLAYDRAGLDRPEVKAYFKSFRFED